MEIIELIRQYAVLYKEFESKQKDNIILPKGDQKTGVIGEYYAKCYAETLACEGTTKFAEPGQVFDLSYKDKGTNAIIKVQVKCVSEHSKTRTIAPLNLKQVGGEKPFDKLYLISLCEEFLPIGFYINSYEEIEKRIKLIKETSNNPLTIDRISGLKMKGKNSKGSRYLDFSDELIGEMLAVLPVAKDKIKLCTQ